jgi:hypothetical protein
MGGAAAHAATTGGKGRLRVTAASKASSQPALLETLESGVLTLTLNRPERLNATLQCWNRWQRR